MNRSPNKLPPPSAEKDRIPGLPDWVTDDWLKETIRAWQPYYKDPLTIQDAAEIIMSWDRLFAFLREEPAG